jgi:hypothetical protein
VLGSVHAAEKNDERSAAGDVGVGAGLMRHETRVKASKEPFGYFFVLF